MKKKIKIKKNKPKDGRKQEQNCQKRARWLSGQTGYKVSFTLSHYYTAEKELITPNSGFITRILLPVEHILEILSARL